MADNSSLSPLSARSGGRWVRLRTLIILRWIAIAGQIAAIFVATWLFQLDLDLGLCVAAVGASIVANLVAIFVYPQNRRVSENELTWWLVFDLSQLGVLLYLTGGLNNPFALLILAPVTISATALNLRSTLIVAAVGIAWTSLLALQHLPLRTELGSVMAMPRDFVIGFWVALVIGIVFLGIYAQRVASEINAMSRALLATQMALAREQKLTDLAGVVAAAAHELGTPLATIKLTSSELISELADNEELREDARLISEQADRCRDILRSMGRAGKEDRHIARAPFSAVIEEAAEPHIARGKEILFDLSADDEVEIDRLPEIIHGLRNLIQNAVDFARSTVWIELDSQGGRIILRIVDDGPGYSQNVIGRIGDPFVRLRSERGDGGQRPAYEGMGLGLFIAKTLLERTGAELTFANARSAGRGASGERSGALVEVEWPRAAILGDSPTRAPLGENVQLDADRA